MSQYFQFNHLRLVDQPNVQLPRGIALDEKLILPRSEDIIFGLLSRENRQRALLNLPLPTVNRMTFNKKRSSSNTEGSSNPRFMNKTYTIKGKKYKIPYQHFGSAVHFSTSICKENEGDENEFYETFVKGFVASYEDNYLEWRQHELGCQNQNLKPVASNERSIEDCLTRHLYDVIECPIIHSLESKIEELVCLIDPFSKQKHGVINGGDVANTVTEAIFNTGGVYSTNFMGIHCFPDMFVGLGATQGPEESDPEAISCTALGETKSPAMQLGGVYHLLTQKSDHLDEDRLKEANEVKRKLKEGDNYRLIFDPVTRFGVSNARKINDFQETVRKVVTTACYCGTNRVMVTTYKYTVLIYIDPKFVMAFQKNFEGDAAFDGKAAVYLKNRHFLIKNSDPMIRLKIASFFHTSDASVDELKLFQRNVGSYLEGEISILLAEQMKASRPPSTPSDASPVTGPSSAGSHNDYLRTARGQYGKQPAAKSPDPKGGKQKGKKYDKFADLALESAPPNRDHRLRKPSMSSIKTWISSKDRSLTSDLFKFPSSKNNIREKENQSQFTDDDDDALAGFKLKETREITSVPQDNQDDKQLVLDGDVFDSCLMLKLADITKHFIQSGRSLSQIAVVDTEAFMKVINSNSIFFSPSNSDKDLVIKVFDPLWTSDKNLNEMELTVEYQNSVDRSVNEIDAYIELAALTGTVIPRCFGYCTIDDCTVSVGERYIRCWGPTIFLENLESQKHPRFGKNNVTKDFIEKRIIPQYQKLHALNVIQGDFRFENMLVTQSKTVKILDFSHSQINATQEQMDSELASIYSYFGVKP